MWQGVKAYVEETQGYQGRIPTVGFTRPAELNAEERALLFEVLEA